MEGFDKFVPRGGVRQPRILYAVDNPSMAVLEELRAFGGYRNLNAVYTEALKIGAEILLQRAAEDGLWVRLTDLPPSPSGANPQPVSPVKVAGQGAHKRSKPARSDVLSAARRAQMPEAAPKSASDKGSAPWRTSSLVDADNMLRSTGAMRPQGHAAPASLSAQKTTRSTPHVPGPPSTFTGESHAAPAATAGQGYRASSAADAQFDQFGD